MRKAGFKCEKGVTIVENLVAISLIAIGIVGSTALFRTAFQSNATARTYTAVVADVQSIFDKYRNMSFVDALSEFGDDYSAIVDGQIVTGSESSASARAKYKVSYTAIKTKAETIPEAVRIKVEVSHRRGQLGNADYVFETLITQVQ